MSVPEDCPRCSRESIGPCHCCKVCGCVMTPCACEYDLTTAQGWRDYEKYGEMFVQIEVNPVNGNPPIDIYRPLFFLVEAVEAEIKRKLGPAQALAPQRHEPTVEDYQKALRQVVRNDSIHLRRDVWDTKMIVGHRCSVCQEFHQIKVEELTYSKQEFVDRLVKETRALLEKPCDIELRTP